MLISCILYILHVFMYMSRYFILHMVVRDSELSKACKKDGESVKPQTLLMSYLLIL